MYRTRGTIEIGCIAPDFNLRDQDGNGVKLSSYRGKENVLLAFYRGAHDIYSLQWLSRLNDDYLHFRSLGTDILAIGPDHREKARYAATRYKIAFKLLSDTQKIVIREYGVFNELEDSDKASVFIVDRAGTIRYRYVGIVPNDLPPNDKLLEALRSIA